MPTPSSSFPPNRSKEQPWKKNWPPPEGATSVLKGAQSGQLQQKVLLSGGGGAGTETGDGRRDRYYKITN
jgi:hypothetical protein